MAGVTWGLCQWPDGGWFRFWNQLCFVIIVCWLFALESMTNAKHILSLGLDLAPGLHFAGPWT